MFSISVIYKKIAQLKKLTIITGFKCIMSLGDKKNLFFLPLLTKKMIIPSMDRKIYVIYLQNVISKESSLPNNKCGVIL